MAGEGDPEGGTMQDLGGGLRLRWATPEDHEALVDFNAQVHREPESEEPNEAVGAWTRELLSGEHPTFGDGGFVLVEDGCTGEIVSTLNLIPQRWSCAGVEVDVGRIELVGTRPDYRRRGLVRAQLDFLHAWSESQGHMLHAITGIPWFYRQFGYEMCLTLGGSRTGVLSDVPELGEGEEERFLLRPATTEDIPCLNRVYRRGARRYLLSCVRDEALWRYELEGRSQGSIERRLVRMVESRQGERVGFLVLLPGLQRKAVVVTVYELKAGTSWSAASASVMRALKTMGKDFAGRKGEADFEALTFKLGLDHPAYALLRARLPRKRKPYAWYLRVADLPGFLRILAPVLEARLADSPLSGHSGELKISFYRQGVRLDIRDGSLVRVEPWLPESFEAGDAAFPDLTFLQLLFGYRSREQLEESFPDCWTEGDETRLLLDMLLPPIPSDLWPVS